MADNPFLAFQNWAAPRSNTLLGLGAGFLSGDLENIPKYAAEGKQADTAYATAKKEEAQRQDQLNQTVAFLQQTAPKYAEAVQAGVLSPGDAYKMYVADSQPKAGTDPYTLSPGQVRYGPDNKPIAEVPAAPENNFDDVSGLRKEILTLPSYKNLAQAAPIYNAMVETAGRDTRASDLNLVYGLGKIMDPGSVVREGEMFLVQGVNTLPSKVVEGINSLLTGQSALSPEARKQILEEAYGRVKGYQDAYGQDSAMYQGITQRNQINPADVIPQFPQFQPWQPKTFNTPQGVVTIRPLS